MKKLLALLLLLSLTGQAQDFTLDLILLSTGRDVESEDESRFADDGNRYSEERDGSDRSGSDRYSEDRNGSEMSDNERRHMCQEQYDEQKGLYLTLVAAVDEAKELEKDNDKNGWTGVLIGLTAFTAGLITNQVGANYNNQTAQDVGNGMMWGGGIVAVGSGLSNATNNLVFDVAALRIYQKTKNQLKSILKNYDIPSGPDSCSDVWNIESFKNESENCDEKRVYYSDRKNPRDGEMGMLITRVVCEDTQRDCESCR